MSVLRRAYVEVEPDVTGFDAALKDKFSRLDPGGKAGKQLGGQLNRALKRVDLDPVDIRADPRKALASINETERKLQALARSASTVEIKVRAEQGLQAITQFKKQLGKAGDDPEPARNFVASFSARVGPLLASMPISAPLAGVLGGAGAIGAPVFASALASGLSSGAGLGVLSVGLGALAQNPVVKLRGAELGKNFTSGLQAAATRSLGAPMLQVFDRLAAAGDRVTADLGRAFDELAPHVDPFAAKVIGAGEAITGSLTKAARESGPALDGMGDAITLVGEGTAYFIDKVSDGGPEAANNLRLVAGATGDLLKMSANTLTVLNNLANNPWITGPLLPLLRKHYAEAADKAAAFEAAQKKLPPELTLTAEAARGQRDALVGLAKEMKAQTDPAFGLIVAQQNLKKAQNDSAEAVKKHGVNSTEARAATRNLALAAIDLQGKAGALGTTFSGKLTPAMIATFRAGGLTEAQISDIETELRAAKTAGDKYDGEFKANVVATGVKGVLGQFNALLVQQRALQSGLSLGAAQAAMQKDLDRNRARAYDTGGWTGPGAKMQPAGIVHADEFVIRKESRQKIERQHPGLLSELNATGQLGGYARGGQVWPFPTTAARTKIPSLAQVLAAVGPVFSSNWPASPAAQRGDSGVWRQVLRLIKSGPKSGSFGNAYRPGDPLWHGCVPMDTRILTRRGWITYGEVAVGEDETIGYNPSTGKNEWTLIVGLHHYEDADLWTLQNSRFRAEVTPGHKWLVDQQVTVQTETVCTECGREFATGRGMTKHRADVHGVLTPRRVRFEEQLVATRDFKQSTRIHLARAADLGGQLPITDDEAELIGWIFGDGYMEPYGPTIVQSKPKQVEYLRGFMAQFACSEYVRAPEARQNHPVFRWKLSCEYWADLSSRSKASKDDALNFVFSLSVSQRASFVRGFLAADGTRDPRTQNEKLGYAAFQVSGPVAEAIKVAAYLEGYRPDTRVKTDFDVDRFGTQPMEHIGFRTPAAQARNLPVVGRRTADVWCPTTTLGTWTARQGEEIFLTGNSGRAVDWMGYEQGALASFLAARKPLELIHRTSRRDYAYTRGQNMGSFGEALMNGHRNHIHIAMAGGGVIREPVMGVGRSGNTYSFGERGPERVLPTGQTTAPGRTYHITVNVPPVAHPAEVGRQVVGAIKAFENANGDRWRS